MILLLVKVIEVHQCYAWGSKLVNLINIQLHFQTTIPIDSPHILCYTLSPLPVK